MKKIGTICLLMIVFGCVDRVFFDIPIPATYGISIGGYISDQPGPYVVNVFRTFDTESNDATRTGVSAKKVTISDNEGTSETLTQVESGVYQTSATGIRGKLGGIYKVTVELGDGRIYESLPDTLVEGGRIDSAYYKVASRYSTDGIEYSFDLYTDVSVDVDITKTHFLWTNHVTYKALTKPEDEPTDPLGGIVGQCYRDPVDRKCNYKELCSGLKNTGSEFSPKFARVKECECCYCWYDQFSSTAILNDKLGLIGGRYSSVLVDRVPVTYWLLMFKMRTELSVFSLSPQSYRFWKAVRDQRTAVSNIFQPITGRIPGNIVQKAGTNEHAEGLFYATSISKKVFYIQRSDVPESLIPLNDSPHKADFSCLKLAPGATAKKPDFWID